MKFAIVLTCLLIGTSFCGEFQSKCKGNAACEECAISWFCDYGNNEDRKEECYKHCLEHKIDYDQHSEVENAKETTVHSFIEKQPAPQPPQPGQAQQALTPAQQCNKTKYCESCGIEYMCEYNSDEQKKQECYSKCIAEERAQGKVGSHDAATNAQETTVHQFIQTGQAETPAQQCNKTKYCESCGIEYMCEYNADEQAKQECYRKCIAEERAKGKVGSHDAATNAQETTVHQFIQTGQAETPAQQCNKTKYCESCGIEYMCEYNADEQAKQECYRKCIAEERAKGKVGSHDAATNAQETTVHQFIQTGQAETPAQQCNKTKYCESCGIEYMCEYNADEQAKQECYRKCIAEERAKGKVGSHDAATNAQETTVHQFIQTGQAETPAQQCNKTKYCESCGIEYMCEYNADEQAKQECYRKCIAEERAKGKVGSHDAATNAQETTVHLVQVKQEIKQGPIEQSCKQNKMCEECGISWGCNSQTIEGIERETCWKGCLDEHDKYDAQHDSTMKQQEISFLQKN